MHDFTPRFPRLSHSLLAVALCASAGLTSARTPDANALFDWAEATYRDFFPGHPANETYPPYVFRRYSSGNYLALANERVYLLGPLTAHQITDLGSVTQFACQVYPSDCASTGTAGDLAEVQTLLRSYDAVWANGTPASGAAATTLTDACYLHNGTSRDAVVAHIDADPAAWGRANVYRVGSVRTNPSIQAVRNLTNSDGSTRREIDVQLDVQYADGTTDSAEKITLISGSSAGSCATPQTGNELRWFGNRRQAEFYVLGRNLVNRTYKLADGTLNSSTLRREVGFGVRDPAGIATYAVVSGAGPSTTSGTQSLSFSVKLLSPRVLRSDPAMAGKRGNFTNWSDKDTFRLCRSANSTAPNAALADCVGYGAQGWSYGVNISPTASNITSGDTNFASLGLGGSYTVKLYNDDGWKTVNGHADKTPVATYTSTLAQLPYTFASLASASDPTAYYPSVTAQSPDSVALAAALRAGVAGSVSLQWSAPVPPDGTAFRVQELGEYFEGPLAGATTTPPGQRWYTVHYPNAAATGYDLPLSATPTSISSKIYSDVELWYTNRNGGRIGLIHAFQ